MNSVAIDIPVKRKRNYQFVDVPAPHGVVRIIEVNGHQPIEIARAPEWTGKTPRYLRTLMEQGKLSAININGTPYKKQKRGSGNRLCFCLKEWINLQL